MADSEKKKGLGPKKEEWLFRQTIRSAKIAKIRNVSYCIFQISDLRLTGNDKIWEKEGINEFTGTAEFYFVPNSEGGVSYSPGNRLRFKGSIEKNGQTYSLISPLTIEDDINSNTFKKYTNE